MPALTIYLSDENYRNALGICDGTGLTAAKLSQLLIEEALHGSEWPEPRKHKPKQREELPPLTEDAILTYNVIVGMGKGSTKDVAFATTIPVVRSFLHLLCLSRRGMVKVRIPERLKLNGRKAAVPLREFEWTVEGLEGEPVNPFQASV